MGILEADRFRGLEMKEKVRKEYFHNIKKILESKLNSVNVVKAINSRVMILIRYGARVIKWKKAN